jgi:hypothetical protein
MMRSRRQLGVLALALLLATTAQAETMRRFALVIGNDEGGSDTRPLSYAREDARKMHGLLSRLGGVAPADSLLLLNEGAKDILSALAGLEARIKAAQARGDRTALLVYYSGHAKDGALRLGDTRLPFDTLKLRLAGGPADIRIAILDSCRSGTMTRTKGARRAPAFEIDSGAARNAQGMVILTSSSADEDSQESDAIGGSYFSHHLTSGLLGDADRSGDGRVTLFEAYSHAYARTVADTAASSAGPQHPTFSYDLAGNGDLVLTDLRASEGLVVPRAAPAGAYYFVDPGGLVVAELEKAPDMERRVALAAGTYRVKRRLEDRLRIGEVEVRRGQETMLEEARFRDAPFSDDPVKGGRGRGSLWTVGLTGGYHSFFNRSIRESLFLSVPLVGAEANLHNYFREDWVWSFDVALGGRTAKLSLDTLSGASYRYSVLTLGTSITTEWHLGGLTPFAGARLTYLYMGHKFDGAVFPDQYYATFSPGLVAGLRYQLLRSLHLTGRGRIHYIIYSVYEQSSPNASSSLGYWELAALVTYEL